MQTNNKIQRNIDLSQFSTFRIGGKAKFYTKVKSKHDLKEAVKFSQERNEKLYFLGGGSNTLINDKIINGLVLRFCNNGIEIKDNNVVCGAGSTLLDILSICMKNGLSGLEWSYGIPRATIGGSVFGNSGGFGIFMSDIVENVEVFDAENFKFIKLNNKECKFSHKNTIFKERKDYIIWEIELKLKNKNSKEIEQTSKNYLQKRIETQSKYFNIGCIFKNVSVKYIEEKNPLLLKKVLSDNLVNNENLSSGWIIDSLGLRGKIIGGAKVSDKHANFIVNFNKAKSDDVVELIKTIKKEAKDKYNITLNEEIQYFGF